MLLLVQVVDMTFCLTAVHADLLSVCTVCIDAYANGYSNASNVLSCVMALGKYTLRHTCSGATLLVPSTELSRWGRRLIAPAPLCRAAIASNVARPAMMVGTAMDLQHHTLSLHIAVGHKWTHTPDRKPTSDKNEMRWPRGCVVKTDIAQAAASDLHVTRVLSCEATLLES